VIGPLGAGFLAEHLGYNGFFLVFAGIAALAATVFLTMMPETKGGSDEPRGRKTGHVLEPGIAG